ncbi:MAG: ISAs1 family transposase [Pyrinomonadaceae bacterium]
MSEVPDPRSERCRRHKLIDILVIAVLAVICGAEGFTEMEEFGYARKRRLKKFLELPGGIPSHDTFGRVFAQLNPTAFEQGFARWVTGVLQQFTGEVVALEGKKLRRSYDTEAGQDPITLVSTWASAQRLTLGQVKVGEGTNEIKAIPALLEALELAGCIVTVDALKTQQEIASQLREKKADDVMAVKGKHKRRQEEVASLLAAVREDRTYGYKIETTRSIDKGDGRIEERTCWHVCAPPERFSEGCQWKDLKSVAMIETRREEGEKVSRKVRYYLSSLEVDAEQMNEVIRTHWTIENSCHWVLDVVFREDDSRVRVGHAAQNLALVRRVALSRLSREKSCKRGVKTKRMKAALELQYLLKVLQT